MKRVPTHQTRQDSAWRRFIHWSGLDIDPDAIPAGEHWSMVRTRVSAILRARYLKPTLRRLLTRSPAWVVAMRLQRWTHCWYRVPTRAAADHVLLRFDFWPIEVGDHVRIERGRLTAIGYANATFSEIIFVEPNGEVERDPDSPEMSRAWAAFWASRQ